MLMSRHFVSKKESSAIIEMVTGFGMSGLTESKIEVETRKDGEFYLINGKPLAYRGENFFPSLQALNAYPPKRNWIEVDDGAVSHLVDGANLFAAGIVSMDSSIRPGDMVFVRNGKGVYFSIMRASRSTEEIMKDRKGEAARSIHFPNDKIYAVFKEILH